MHINWSVVLNVLLLIMVVGAIVRTLKLRKQQSYASYYPTGSMDLRAPDDDVIAVRKISRDDDVPEAPVVSPDYDIDRSSFREERVLPTKTSSQREDEKGTPVMMLIRAKEGRQFVGYELLQTLLSAGLRFGEGNLFHRHQENNDNSYILCSVAAATASGKFDLQNISVLSVRGLCIFMPYSSNSALNAERFEVMVDTARQLCEGLDADWLSQDKEPITEAVLDEYQQKLGIVEAYAAV